MPLTKDNIFISDIQVPIDLLDLSLGHYIINKLTKEHSQKTLFIDWQSGREWTGQQLRERILAIAATLITDYNFQPGTCVCISYDNCDWTIILGLAVVCAGGILAGAYSKDPYAELIYQARKIKPKFLFCHQKNLTWARQLEKDLGYSVVGMAVDSQEFQEFFNRKPGSNETINLKLPVACKDLANEVAFITMSSGTTGKPKAVPASHKNCLVELAVASNRGKAGCRTCTASFDYVSGRFAVLSTIHRGSKTIIMDGFEPKTYLEAVEKFKVDAVYLGAASFYHLIAYEFLDRYDISSVEVVGLVGAKMTYLDKVRGFFEKYPHIKQMAQFYGASEISVCSFKVTTPEQYVKQCDNNGKLMPLVEAKIVNNATGKALGRNQEGSLHVRGPCVFNGYYDLDNSNNNNCSSSSPFINDSTVFDADGFYMTGDLAYFDQNEELFIVGREKELMSCRGAKKVVPQELEELIAEHPAVANACVMGVPNLREPTLHCPRAFVQIKANLDLETVLTCSGNSANGSTEAELEHRGDHKLCSLATEQRHRLAESIMNYVNERIGWEKQLTGGLVLLDWIPLMRETGKMNKKYLASLGLGEVEIYGDRSG